MTKEQIRIDMKNERNAFSKEERSFQNSEIAKKLYEMDQYRKCTDLFTYVSFQSEVDTREIITDAFLGNKRVFAPRVEGRDMNFYEINDFYSLIPSKFGVPEPKPGKPYVSTNDINSNDKNDREIRLMLLPGLAFDPEGNRIGYGAGYYDRYLARFSKDYFLKIALAYDFQILKQVNGTEYDVKADMIITPNQIIKCK